MDQGNTLTRIPFILITGFLGSGKTTLVLDLVRRYSGNLRFAVVQNEFTPGHVDGTTLRRSGEDFELLEINNGSVFCACLLNDFIDRLVPFIDKTRPDVIVLEATGLADPVSLGQIIHSGKLADRIFLAASWCIVDAANFHRIIGSVSRTRQQIRIADLVVINKTDLVSHTGEIREGIREINPFAGILETSFGAAGQVDFRHLLHHPASRVSGSVSGVPDNRPSVGSCVVRFNRFFDPDAVERFIGSHAASLYRMKGYVRISQEETMVIQTVFEAVNLTRVTNYHGPTELIAIGPELDIRQFSDQFLALQKKQVT